MAKPLNFNPYSYSGSILNLRVASWLVGGALFAGIFGFMWLEGYTFTQALYMTVITFSTVGFSEVQPLSANGQVFTTILIIVYIGIFAYTLSAFTFFIIEGEIFNRLHQRFLENKINALHGHVILCGYGRYGQRIVQNFIDHDVQFVVIDKDDEKVDRIRKGKDAILYLNDDATNNEVLLQAGVERASALIAAMPDDANNVFAVLTARQLNPAIKIISRATSDQSIPKLELAGANHVIMPEQIGGFYMATLVNKPGTINFFSYLTSQVGTDVDIEEFSYRQMPPHCKDRSIRDLHIRRESGANIIAYKHPDGHYTVNPGPDTVIGPDSSFIVLGSKEQLNFLRRYLAEFHE
ncbi:MAG: potassium channel protein [Phaeodactylibacter sp.]|nr:potassium channel protein [Phaeodactylibacter sp.]